MTETFTDLSSWTRKATRPWSNHVARSMHAVYSVPALAQLDTGRWPTVPGTRMTDAPGRGIPRKKQNLVTEQCRDDEGDRAYALAQCVGPCLRKRPCCQSCIKRACGARASQTRVRSAWFDPRIGMPASRLKIGRQGRFRTSATLSPMAREFFADSWWQRKAGWLQSCCHWRPTLRLMCRDEEVI